MDDLLVEFEHVLSIFTTSLLQAPGCSIVEVKLIGGGDVAAIWLRLEEEALLHVGVGGNS